MVIFAAFVIAKVNFDRWSFRYFCLFFGSAALKTESADFGTLNIKFIYFCGMGCILLLSAFEGLILGRVMTEVQVDEEDVQIDAGESFFDWSRRNLVLASKIGNICQTCQND